MSRTRTRKRRDVDTDPFEARTWSPALAQRSAKSNPQSLGAFPLSARHAFGIPASTEPFYAKYLCRSFQFPLHLLKYRVILFCLILFIPHFFDLRLAPSRGQYALGEPIVIHLLMMPLPHQFLHLFKTFLHIHGRFHDFAVQSVQYREQRFIEL